MIAGGGVKIAFIEKPPSFPSFMCEKNFKLTRGFINDKSSNIKKRRTLSMKYIWLVLASSLLHLQVDTDKILHHQIVDYLVLSRSCQIIAIHWQQESKFFGEGGLISKGGLNEIFDFWRKISETDIKITN